MIVEVLERRTRIR